MKKDSTDHRTVITQVLNFFNSGHKEFVAPVPTYDIARRMHCSRRNNYAVVPSVLEAQSGHGIGVIKVAAQC
jgi:hypothetical protein